MEGSRLFRTQCRFCVSCPHRPRTGTLNLATSHIACVLRIHLAPHRLAIHLIVECQRAFDPDECACHRHAQHGQPLHREMRLHQWWMRWPRREVRYRSEEHTSELQSLMRISYAVFCLKKNTNYKLSHIILHT